MKRCTRCRRLLKISEFNRHRSNPDGRQRTCRKCQVEANRESRERRRVRTGRGEAPRRHPHDPANNHKIAAYRARNPEKVKAYRAVHNAVAAGRLVFPGECEKCGRPGYRPAPGYVPPADELLPIHAHHVDYSKPLDVDWLCAPCHKVSHRDEVPA